MVDTLPRQVDAFRRHLEQAQVDYLHTTPPADMHAHIRFIGVFEESPVIWNATIMTLDHYARFTHTASTTTGQFIEIDPDEGNIRNIRVGLKLTRINEQVILKTIIMIRKYKRLHVGRHPFSHT